MVFARKEMLGLIMFIERFESGMNSGAKRKIRLFGFGDTKKIVEFEFVRTFEIGVEGSDRKSKTLENC